MKLSVKGVLLGAVADIVATNVLAIPIILVVDARLMQSGPGTAPSALAFTQAMKSSPGLYFTGLVLGSVASVFGGWVAARVARRAEVLNGAVSAVACMGIGVYGMMRYPQSAPLWQHIGFLILSPVLGALGGVIERRQSSHDAMQPVQSPTVAALAPAPALRGVQRSVYVANRLLLIAVVLMFLLFVLGGLASYAQHQSQAIVGTIVLSVLSLIAAGLLVAGAKSVRRGHASHWAFHVGALAAIAFPVAAIALGLAMQHRR